MDAGDLPLHCKCARRALERGRHVIYSSRWFAFDIPDEWMAAAGMRGFVPRRTEYRARPHGNADLATIILLVDDIGVARRGAGVPDLDRDRMVSVLSAIRLDQAFAARRGCRRWRREAHAPALPRPSPGGRLDRRSFPVGPRRDRA